MRGNKKQDQSLPPRLFETDRFPSGRLNIYSKPDYLPFLQHVLRGTKELQFIKDSCFGKLFELPARHCPVSCKLIHGFLTRQLVCDDSHTLWTVFGSDPIRFGLQEFGTITGLPCGEFPSDYNTDLEDQCKAHKDPDWIKLIGKKRFTTIADIRHKLETDSRMPSWKKLRLALIIIVDGVLIAHQQTPRPTLKYVKMVQDVDAFCLHPWGRESFLKTISCMKPPKLVPSKCDDPISTLAQLLKQETFRLKGFPLALQLLAFQAVPKLQTIIPAPFDTLSINELEEPHLPLHSNISYLDILRVEADENLAVTSLIPIHSQQQTGWGVWKDEFEDERLAYMENLIANHHPFKKHHWPGGDSSQPIHIYKPPEVKPVMKRNSLRPRKGLNKTSSHRKQTRISNYFSRTGSSSTPDDSVLQLLTKVLTQVSKLRKETKEVRKMLKRRKTRIHSKRSAFNVIIERSHRGCQTDPAHQTVVPNNPTPEPMDEDMEPHNSPLVSQYAAQHYGPHLQRNSAHNSPVHQSPEHSSPEHKSPEHSCPEHKSPEHNNPEHNDAEHRSHNHKSPEPKTPDNTSPIRAFTLPTSPIPTNQDPIPDSPSGTPPWLRSPKPAPVQRRSYIYRASEHPNSPEFHRMLHDGLEIFEPISPDEDSLNAPRYDTSTHRDKDKPRAKVPPLPFEPICPVGRIITPDTSPTKSSGFGEHASSVNAFLATATSKRTPLPLLTWHPSQDSAEQDDCVELSDSSPAKPTPRHQPSDEERLLAEELFRCPSVPALALLTPLPQAQWDLFRSTLESLKQVFHITPSKFDFSNKFILEIAEPQKWVTTFHMEILMYMLAGRHRDLFEREKLAFTTPYLASGIMENFKRFKAVKRKDRFHWDDRVTEIVLKPGKKWMEDAVTIYTPMIWAEKHWVGLAINLDMGLVEILDPLPSLFSDKKVEKFMAPLLTSLPYLVKKVAKPIQTQFGGLKPFRWNRLTGIYINERSGDCGPVSIKFMELHAHGDPAPHMSAITDGTVDDIRKQYAMDVYKTIVLPAYHAPTFP